MAFSYKMSLNTCNADPLFSGFLVLAIHDVENPPEITKGTSVSLTQASNGGSK